LELLADDDDAMATLTAATATTAEPARKRRG